MHIYHTYASKKWRVGTITISERKEYYSGYSKAVHQLIIPFNPNSDDVIRVKPYANPKG